MRAWQVFNGFFQKIFQIFKKTALLRKKGYQSFVQIFVQKLPQDSVQPKKFWLR